MKKIFVLMLIMCCSGFLSAEKVAAFPELANPGSPVITDNYIYIRDGISINIYSLPGFKLHKKFGKEGEGPREFKRAIYWWGIRGDSLIVQSRRRLTYFSKDGDYIKEMNLRSMNSIFIPVGKRFVGLRNFIEKSVIYYKFRLFDENHQFLKFVLSYKNSYQKDKPFNPFYEFDWPLYKTCAGKIFIENREKDSIIEVFDSNGDKLYSVGQDIEAKKVTAEDVRIYTNFFKTTTGFKESYAENKRFFIYPDYFPKIRDFRLADNKVYVLTYETKGRYTRFVIYDMSSGKRLEEKMVPLQKSDELFYYRFSIKDGKLYQWFWNEDNEVWELHVTPL